MDLILFIQVIGRNIKLQVDWYCMQKHKKNQQIISRLVFCEIKKHKKISKKNPLKLKTIWWDYFQACKLAGARRITAVLPLLPYARWTQFLNELQCDVQHFVWARKNLNNDLAKYCKSAFELRSWLPYRGDMKQPDKRKPIGNFLSHSNFCCLFFWNSQNWVCQIPQSSCWHKKSWKKYFRPLAPHQFVSQRQKWSLRCWRQVEWTKWVTFLSVPLSPPDRPTA